MSESQDTSCAVNRCLCHDLSFEYLCGLAEEKGLDFEGLQKETNCSMGCGLCEPYVRLMLKTGKTDFPVLSAEEIERVMGDGGETRGELS